MTDPTPEDLVAQAYVEGFIKQRCDGPPTAEIGEELVVTGLAILTARDGRYTTATYMRTLADLLEKGGVPDGFRH